MLIDALCMHFIRSAIKESTVLIGLWPQASSGDLNIFFFFDPTADSRKLKCDGEVTGSVAVMLICARASSLHTRGLISTAFDALYLNSSKGNSTRLRSILFSNAAKRLPLHFTCVALIRCLHTPMLCMKLHTTVTCHHLGKCGGCCCWNARCSAARLKVWMLKLCHSLRILAMPAEPWTNSLWMTSDKEVGSRPEALHNSLQWKHKRMCCMKQLKRWA